MWQGRRRFNVRRPTSNTVAGSGLTAVIVDAINEAVSQSLCWLQSHRLLSFDATVRSLHTRCPRCRQVLVNENQLDNWVRGNAREAQGLIVELVARLVAASVPRPRER
jgi:hypothetical protein